MSPEPSVGEIAAGREVAWLDEQLRELRGQHDQIQRELDALRSAMREQQRGASEFEGALATVEGRTRRHEAGQELARELRHEIETLGQRLEEESALRRDQRGALGREQQRDRELAESVVTALEDFRARLDTLEQRLSGEGERTRRLGDQLVERDRAEQRLGEQMAGAEGRIAALAETWAKEREERVRFTATLPELGSSLDEIDARTLALRSELRRSEESLAELRSRGDREDELHDLIDQQRAIRLRLEERLRDLETRLEDTLQRASGAAEERLALGQQVTGAEARMRALGEALEGQRWAMIEHFRRLIEAEEQHGRQQIDEIEKRIRGGRSLLVRLTEVSQQAGEEQPL